MVCPKGLIALVGLIIRVVIGVGFIDFDTIEFMQIDFKINCHGWKSTLFSYQISVFSRLPSHNRMPAESGLALQSTKGTLYFPFLKGRSYDIRLSTNCTEDGTIRKETPVQLDMNKCEAFYCTSHVFYHIFGEVGTSFQIYDGRTEGDADRIQTDYLY